MYVGVVHYTAGVVHCTVGVVHWIVGVAHYPEGVAHSPVGMAHWVVGVVHCTVGVAQYTVLIPIHTSIAEGVAPINTSTCVYNRTCLKDHSYIKTTCLQRPQQAGSSAASVILKHLCTRTTCPQRPQLLCPLSGRYRQVLLYIRYTHTHPLTAPSQSSPPVLCVSP